MMKTSQESKGQNVTKTLTVKTTWKFCPALTSLTLVFTIEEAGKSSVGFDFVGLHFDHLEGYEYQSPIVGARKSLYRRVSCRFSPRLALLHVGHSQARGVGSARTPIGNAPWASRLWHIARKLSLLDYTYCPTPSKLPHCILFQNPTFTIKGKDWAIKSGSSNR